ncbi:MAG: hydantoinase B/oxoprolinase family protein, partial [Rhizobiales bacterium]|nr:hydantoinase B/oxoprolinase family protein [Hyphomicrobiales bacterium]
MSNLDPFTQQIIRNYLFSTTEEMIQTTVLTAYSPTFSEGFDFSCALFDRSGKMVIQSRGVGVHLGSLVGAM